jgi:2-polyprenyl-6-methoxyphenol hydroxylase-like FAD-dependent oxidoreductase
MADIAIIGSGIAGLHLGLSLQACGIPATIYTERTPEQQLARRLPNMVARNACTRARERRLGVNHWDEPTHDMGRLAVRLNSSPALAFSGRMQPPQAVDMRIYCARLLEDFSRRGGRVVVRAVAASELDSLASAHDLLVIASGRATLGSVFARVEEHSPFATPQRLVVAGLFRGIRRSDPVALEANVVPGSGEILAVPMQSFEPDLTGMAILVVTGGSFELLRHLRYDEDRLAFLDAVSTILRAHAPRVFERLDPRVFDLSRPHDLGYAAITPTVRRGFAMLPNGRPAIALGDAHVIMDPLTGQGANNAAHAADVLCEAIRTAAGFDAVFCERVERRICAYVLPVSEAANARVRPPAAPFRALLAAASRDQAIADFYADGYNHPDRFWAIAGSEERTAAFLREHAALAGSAPGA